MLGNVCSVRVRVSESCVQARVEVTCPLTVKKNHTVTGQTYICISPGSWRRGNKEGAEVQEKLARTSMCKISSVCST